MTTSKTLDPSTCTTAPQAFLYPLPQVRQFHRTLTLELDEKNARLRTLVGGSYRQLLGTAEMILTMRDDIGRAEEKLGRVGKGCGRGVVGGMAGGLAKLGEGRREGERYRELEWGGRMKVLDMCVLSVGRLMRRGGVAGDEEGKGKNLVVAAKVLVLSRLLVKSVDSVVSRRGPQDREAVDEIKKKLKVLRRRLEKAVDRTLEKIGDNREDLIQALCAYSLATSYGAKDVLRHFLHVRGQAMALLFDEEGENVDATGVVKALELYTKTLLDVQALVPRRLSEALASLKAKPLLKDQSIRAIEGLRLDVCEKWFGDEIMFFMPYIRHDDLEGPHAVSTLRSWAKEASEVMLKGFAKTLDVMPEFKSVVDLRTKILEIWIKEGGKAKGFDPSILLDGLREVVNKRLVSLLQSRIGKLHLVATEIEGTLSTWQAGTTDKQESLWDETMLETEITNGATLFKQSIVSRTHGRNDAVSRVYRGYQTWRHLIDEIMTVIEQLKKQKWDDDLEDIEDDLSLESRNTLLSIDDPKMLQEHLNTSLEKSYKELHEKIGSLLNTYQEGKEAGQISIYLLRSIRDIRSELPSNPTLRHFGLALIPTLHEQLASTTSSAPLDTFTKSFRRKKVAGRALWEGEPDLPVQPSPATFRFLHGLAEGMVAMGCDLWSPVAVGVLKGFLCGEVGERWGKAVEEREREMAEEVNGASTSGNGEVVKGEVEASEVAVKEEGEEPKDTKFSEATRGESKESKDEPSLEAPGEDAKDPTLPNASVDSPSTNSAFKSTRLPFDAQAHKDVLIQSLFDVSLLQDAFAVPTTVTKAESDDGLNVLQKSLEAKTSLEEKDKKRLEGSAKEYWRRTGLLFGLLGQHS